jgi:tRNA U34 5-methylaminomethyl-2-thiouridine-forming methyltransferase MnmC
LKLTKNIITTADGSKTIAIKEWNEQYHSTHGAIQESEHVYIKAGLEQFPTHTQPVKILEFGFGTGLNALLTLKYAHQHNINIHYHTLEAFPVPENLLNELDYPEKLQVEISLFKQMHVCPFNNLTPITSLFDLYKENTTFENFIPKQNNYHLVYFDVFGYRVQPELWQPEILEKAYQALLKNGIFVTYSAKGQLKRDLKAIGFKVETLPGPPGKREMIRAIKI